LILVLGQLQNLLPASQINLHLIPYSLIRNVGFPNFLFLIADELSSLSDDTG
jgi:hypothetical protein